MSPRAPKICGKDLGGGQFCYDEAVAGKRHCASCGNTRWPTDQPERSDRSDSAVMQGLRADICLAADYRCQIRYVGVCTGEGSELDHIIPHFEGGEDSWENSQCACPPCHAAKSSDEGHRAQGHRVKPRARIMDSDAGTV